MRVLVTGASGFIGSALVPWLESRGHAVVRLVRRPSSETASEVFWDPAGGHIDSGALEGIEGVVHLAGESVFGLRWTQANKTRILESRVKGTQLLSQTLAGLSAKPGVLVSASAVGIYGDRGDEMVDESTPSGDTFLAGVCRAWEAAAEAARTAGIRVVHPRIGVVLDPAGAALKTMLPAFKLGAGGVLGAGRQFMPWITRADLLEVIERCLADAQLAGPINAVAPQPVTNREFTRALARVLHRPALFPVPAALLRGLLGQMAEEMLLASCRAVPARLERAGFVFHHDQVERALREMLDAGRPPAGP